MAVFVAGHFAGPEFAVLAGAAAFIGRCFPLYLNLNGGKGVATFMGTLLAIAPPLGGSAIAVWAVTAGILRISSLAALVAALSAPFITYYLYGGFNWVPVPFMTLVIFIRHRENISRITTGTEPRIGAKKKSE
ncbi:MAG: glycerol-3-phosphate acyltransferase [Kordiimonadaceae bacterium]|nr:glycerol-3-phosphate acyltransferase [Kordiimonadaceae bacterium]